MNNTKSSTRSGGKPTIKHVAAEAGVGVGTVSRVLNEEQGVSSAMRERVLRVAKDLGYARSSVGRSLKTGMTGNVGVAIMSRHAPVILNPFYAVVIGGIEEVLEEHDRHLLLSSLRRKGHLLDLAKEGRVDALLVVGCDIDSTDLELLKGTGRPVVLVDHSHPGLPSVTVDHVAAGRLAAEHLMERGCRRPAFVSENLENPNFRMRLEGFKAVLDEHGVKLSATGIAAGGDSWEGGYHAMNRVLASGVTPDGVFAANDPAALSAMRALNEAGLKVPQDVKIVGCDDIHLASQSQPPLTTLAIEKRRLGQLGAELAIELLAGEAVGAGAATNGAGGERMAGAIEGGRAEVRTETIVLTPTLTVRAST